MGCSKESLVVVIRHLWLTLTEMKESEKMAQLDSPVSPQGIFYDAVGSFSERFLEAQKLDHVPARPCRVPERCSMRRKALLSASDVQMFRKVACWRGCSSVPLHVASDSAIEVIPSTDQGGARSRTLKRLAECLLLWADVNLNSIREFCVPGHLNCGVDMLSREGVVHGEWRLQPQMVQLIWSLFREAVLSQDQTMEGTHPSVWCQSLFSPALDEDVEWNEVLRRCEAFHSSRLSLPLATLTGWMC
ncbi:unnamed protein product [Leuciscus chuanchicus]